MDCDPAAVLVPYSYDCAAPVSVRRTTWNVADDTPYLAPLIVDVESFNKVAKDVQVFIAGFSYFFLDAFSTLVQYA